MPQPRLRRLLLVDRCGTASIAYSSLLLLLAIGAIAILVQTGVIDVPLPRPASITSAD